MADFVLVLLIAAAIVHTACAARGDASRFHLAVATNRMDDRHRGALCNHLLLTAAIHNVTVWIEGHEPESYLNKNGINDGRAKIFAFKELVDFLADNDTLMVIDTFDTLLQKDSHGIMSTYMAMNREVNKRIAMEGGQNDSTAIDSISNVSSNNSSGGNGSDPNNARVSREHHIFFSAETNCWPTYLEAKGWCTLQPESPFGYPARYLNAGGYIGPVRKLRKFMRLQAKNSETLENGDDQASAAQVMLFQQDQMGRIYLDYESRLFLSAFSQLGELQPAHPRQFNATGQSPLKWSHSGFVPAVLHFNGPSKWEMIPWRNRLEKMRFYDEQLLSHTVMMGRVPTKLSELCGDVAERAVPTHTAPASEGKHSRRSDSHKARRLLGSA